MSSTAAPKDARAGRYPGSCWTTSRCTSSLVRWSPSSANGSGKTTLAKVLASYAELFTLQASPYQ
jgi:hypothetical protein